MSLPEELAASLLAAVVDGRYPTGAMLPPEGHLAEMHTMSRLTVREAVRILRSQGVVEIRRGRGTYINPPDQWTSLEALVAFQTHQDGVAGVAEKLLEARRLVEIGAVQLAAVHRTEEELEQLRACLEEMRAGHERADVDVFVEADIAFHDVIMRASGNLFVPFMFEPFGELLVHTRRQTSAVPAIQSNAIAQHEQILEALVTGDPERCRRAMESHMEQTQDDLRTYVRQRSPG
jgi:DNA-binding FadR family transcriptional regulator